MERIVNGGVWPFWIIILALIRLRWTDGLKTMILPDSADGDRGHNRSIIHLEKSGAFWLTQDIVFFESQDIVYSRQILNH